MILNLAWFPHTESRFASWALSEPELGGDDVVNQRHQGEIWGWQARTAAVAGKWEACC